MRLSLLVEVKEKKKQNHIYWDPKKGKACKEDFEGFDCVIHLAGKNIASGLWTKKFKKDLFTSRCRDSWFLSQILVRLAHPPKTLICASAIGFYGNRGEEILTEESVKGKGFIADLCQKWEAATRSVEARNIRRVHTRFGLVLSTKGGMLAKLLPIFRLGLGAVLGSGRQKVSWISLEDTVYGLCHVLMTEKLQGPVNFTTPVYETNKTLSQKLAKAMHRPIFFRIGEKPLKFFFKEFAEETLLVSSAVLPQKMQQSGYQFFYPTLEEELQRQSLRSTFF